jgi:hypothetical protein
LPISAAFENKEQAFLDFVLSHYVRAGVQELDQEKLTPLLRLNDPVVAVEMQQLSCRRGGSPGRGLSCVKC